MPIIRTGKTGTGLNSSQTGVMQGAVGGGGGGILLPGLVGWALTAGPQQTLSSAGVIASGPLDLTANGSITYDADGANLTGTQYLSVASAVALQAGSAALFMYCEYLANPPYPGVDEARTDSLVAKAATDGAYLVEYSLHAIAHNSSIPEDDQSRPYFNATDNAETFDITPQPIPSPVNALSQFQSRMVMMAWWGASGTVYKVQQNNEAVGSATAADLVRFAGSNPLNIGRDIADGLDNANGKIRRVRLWIGDTATLIGGSAAIRTWLYNSGNGRTDAEIAAYAG